MSGYTVINILDMLETVGEDELCSILSDFLCLKNPEIECFIHNNAIEFAKRKMSITYLVFGGDARLIAYFALTHKPFFYNLDSYSERCIIISTEPTTPLIFMRNPVGLFHLWSVLYYFVSF